MAAFANSAKYWLDQDPENVCSMHCKAGKGRAGVMGCVLLVRSGACQSAKGEERMHDRIFNSIFLENFARTHFLH